MHMEDIMISVTPGELADRLTIWRLKSQKINDLGSRAVIDRTLSALEKKWIPFNDERTTGHFSELAEVNMKLWDLENLVRTPGHSNDKNNFCQAAQEIFNLNDQRAIIKRQIDQNLGWQTQDIKHHA